MSLAAFIGRPRYVHVWFARFKEFDRSTKYERCICWRCQICGAFFYTPPEGPPGSCPYCGEEA